VLALQEAFKFRREQLLQLVTADFGGALLTVPSRDE
jgi:hypothetical protein